MKICLAQQEYVAGDIQKNIENHRNLILRAVKLGVDAVFFPELSITGYEPDLAKSLAFEEYDERLNAFQEITDPSKITIGVGLPVRRKMGVTISMAIFQPGMLRKFHDKKYLHADEEPYFISGNNLDSILIKGRQIALAICYELSVSKHAEEALSGGAKFYLTSVAKFKDGVESASTRLAEIASEYGVHTLMVNAVGESDGGICTGNSAVWDSSGKIIAQMDDCTQGLLMFDTETFKYNKIDF